jgi:hypothetical protein
VIYPDEVNLALLFLSAAIALVAVVISFRV